MNEFPEGLLVSSVSGAALTALLLLAKPFARDKISHRGQYFIWYPVFLRMLIPFSFGGFILGGFPTAQSPAVPPTAGSAPAGLSSAAGAAASSAEAAGAFFAGDGRVWIFALWLLGFLALLGLNLAGYIGYGRRVRSSRRRAEGAQVAALLRECGAKLGIRRLPPVYVSPCTGTPVLTGIFRCSIVLPDRGFTPERLRHAFLHELAHFRRHDNLLKWIAALAVWVQWFNPAAWLAAREAARQCELACDEAATAGFPREERLRYGETLIAIAARSGRRPFALSATMSREKRDLKERLKALAGAESAGRRKALSVWLVSAAAAAAALTLTVSCAEGPASPAPQSAGTGRPGFSASSQGADDVPRIAGTAGDVWKTKYGDIGIANEWISAVGTEETRRLALAGALKSDPRQGVVEVVVTDRRGTAVKSDRRFLCPLRSGSLKVSELGAKDFTMGLEDEDGNAWNFSVFNGFDPPAPVSSGAASSSPDPQADVPRIKSLLSVLQNTPSIRSYSNSISICER